MIYLDTHVVVWLYAGITEKFSEVSKTLINKNELFVSPMLLLELQYMYEIDRINVRPDEVISDMSHRLGLRVFEIRTLPQSLRRACNSDGHKIHLIALSSPMLFRIKIY